jgi:hypothetical protein
LVVTCVSAVTSNLEPLLGPRPCQGNQQPRPTTTVTTGARRLQSKRTETAGQGIAAGCLCCWPCETCTSQTVLGTSSCHVTAGSGGVCMGSLPCGLVQGRYMQIANRTFSSSLGQHPTHRDDASHDYLRDFNTAAVQVRHPRSHFPSARPQSPKRCVAQAALSRSCCSTTPVAAMVPRAITP